MSQVTVYIITSMISFILNIYSTEPSIKIKIMH